MRTYNLRFWISIFLTVTICYVGIMNSEARMQDKKAVMIVANRDYRDEELGVPLALLKSKGIEVKIASTSLSTAKGMLGGSIKPDMLIDDIKSDDFDAIIFIGGSGASAYWNDAKAHKIAIDAAEKDKILAAICIAPVTLANAGVLKGRNATVWPSEAQNLKAKGANYTKKGVEVDGKIITADGPSSADKFAAVILNELER